MKNALIPLILTAGSICMADDTQPLKFSLREVEFCSFLPYGQCPDEDFDTAVNLIWSAPFEGDTQTGDYADEYDEEEECVDHGECSDDGTPYAAVKEVIFLGNLTDAKGNSISLDAEYLDLGDNKLELSLINKSLKPTSLQFAIEGTLSFVYYKENDTATLAPIHLLPDESTHMGLYSIRLSVAQNEEWGEEYDDAENMEDFEEEDTADNEDEEDYCGIIIDAHDSAEARNFISRIYAISFSGTDFNDWIRIMDDSGEKLIFEFSGPTSTLRNGGELQLHIREGGTTYTVPFNEVIDLTKR